MRLKRLLLLSVLALFVGAPALTASPLRELRSFWIATVWALDWPQDKAQGTSMAMADKQKQQMTELLDRLAEANYNAIWFQVRSMCDAMYDSKYEPWSSNLTGTRGATPAYDPLEFIVEECHKRGMECHAWFVTFPLGTDKNVREQGKASVVRRHRDFSSLIRKLLPKRLLSPL